MDVYGGIHGIRKGEEQKQETLLKQHQVHPVAIDAADPTTLVHQFKEVQDLFIIPPSTVDKVAKACNYIDAAREADVKFVLLLSVVGAERDDYSWGRQFADIEAHLKKKLDKGCWCILRTPFYMQNLLLYKSQISQGHLPLPIGSGKFAPLDVEDVGVAAGVILSDCSSHKGKVYELTGAETMDGDCMAKTFTRIMGKQIVFRDVQPEEAKVILQNENVPDVEVRGLLDFYSVVKKGEMNKTTRDFKQVTGKDPNTLEHFLNSHKADLF